jgi:hypothetical protein
MNEATGNLVSPLDLKPFYSILVTNDGQGRASRRTKRITRGQGVGYAALSTRERRKIRGGREEEVRVCPPDWNERWKAPPAAAEAEGGWLERSARPSEPRLVRDRLSAELAIALVDDSSAAPPTRTRTSG